MGRYRRTWDLYQLKLTDDEAGGQTEVEEFVKKVQVTLNPIQGTRAVQFSQIIDGKPYTMDLRFTEELLSSNGSTKQIKKDYFFKSGDRELIIHDVMNVNEDSKFLQLLVWEKA